MLSYWATGNLGRVSTEFVPLHYLGLALGILGSLAVGYSLRCAPCGLWVIYSSD